MRMRSPSWVAALAAVQVEQPPEQARPGGVVTWSVQLGSAMAALAALEALAALAAPAALDRSSLEAVLVALLSTQEAALGPLDLSPLLACWLLPSWLGMLPF